MDKLLVILAVATYWIDSDGQDAWP